MSKALVVIDIQNDITKHYKDIVEGINKAIDWAKENGMYILFGGRVDAAMSGGIRLQIVP